MPGKRTLRYNSSAWQNNSNLLKNPSGEFKEMLGRKETFAGAGIPPWSADDHCKPEK